jgi:hypothetical protein
MINLNSDDKERIGTALMRSQRELVKWITVGDYYMYEMNEIDKLAKKIGIPSDYFDYDFTKFAKKSVFNEKKRIVNKKIKRVK